MPSDPAAVPPVEEHLPLVRAQMPGVQRIDVDRVVPIGNGAAPGGQRAAGHAQQISTGGAPTILSRG